MLGLQACRGGEEESRVEEKGRKKGCCNEEKRMGRQERVREREWGKKKKETRKSGLKGDEKVKG